MHTGAADQLGHLRGPPALAGPSVAARWAHGNSRRSLASVLRVAARGRPAKSHRVCGRWHPRPHSSVVVAPTATLGQGGAGGSATAGAVVTAVMAAGPRRLWAITPTTTFFCRRWRQRPQTAKRGSERDRPLTDDQAPGLVLGGRIVPFATTPSIVANLPTIMNGRPRGAAVGAGGAPPGSTRACPVDHSACCAATSEGGMGRRVGPRCVVVVAHRTTMGSSSALRSIPPAAARDGIDLRDTP